MATSPYMMETPGPARSIIHESTPVRSRRKQATRARPITRTDHLPVAVCLRPEWERAECGTGGKHGASAASLLRNAGRGAALRPGSRARAHRTVGAEPAGAAAGA